MAISEKKMLNTTKKKFSIIFLNTHIPVSKNDSTSHTILSKQPGPEGPALVTPIGGLHCLTAT